MENITYGIVAQLHCDGIQPEMRKKTRRGRRTPKRLAADLERTKVGQTHKDRKHCRLSTPGAPSNDNSFLIDDKSENVNYDDCDEPISLPDEFNEYHTFYLDSQDVGYCSSSPSSEYSISHGCSPSHDLDPCDDSLSLYEQLQHLPKEVLINKILSLQPYMMTMLEPTEPAVYEPQASSFNGGEISPAHQKYTV